MPASGMLPSRRRRLGLLCVAAIALLMPMGIALGSGDGFSRATSHPMATLEPFPTPERATHRSTATTGDAEATTFVPPGSDPPWIADSPTFAGRTLHWVSEILQTSLNTAGDLQEQRLHGAFWIEVAPNGRIHRGLELFTDKHGDVYQVSSYKRGQITMVWGVGTHPGATSSSCTQSGSARDPQMAFPEYVEGAGVLLDEGFLFIGNMPVTPPVVTGIEGVAPLVIYRTSATAPTWTSVDQRTPGLVIYRTLGADPTSRLVMGVGKAVSDDGTVESVNEFTQSDLYVYDPVDVPASVFDAPQTDAAACSR